MQCNNDQFYEFFSFLLHWLVAKVKTGNIHFFLDGGGGVGHHTHSPPRNNNNNFSQK